MSPAKRAGAALLLVFTLTLAACGRGGEVVQKEFPLTLRERALPAEQQVIRVRQGDEVLLRWRTDEPASVHLHGYDIEKRIRPDSPVTMWFVAQATGRFPITLHGEQEGEEVTVGYLEVHPR